MADDSELLQQYARDRSEAAFRELVSRHLRMVYCAARRQVGGDAHRAEDVSQAVFTQLALKAPALAGRASVAGWLYTCAKYVAARAARGERRRQIREEQVGAMIHGEQDPAAALDWQALEPVIDGALHGLADRDREIVLLRFFQENSFAEIGAKLGFSADAARFRMDRALEKMRAHLARRGVQSTATALGAALVAQASAAVPDAGAVAGVALAAHAPAAAALTASRILMSTLKTKAGIAAAVVATGLGFLAYQNLKQEQRLQALQGKVLQAQAEHDRLVTQSAANFRVAADAAGRLNAARTKMAQRHAAAQAEHPDPNGLKAGMTAIDEAKNAGRGTPAATVQTLLWADHGGEVDALAEMMAFDPKAKAAADRLWTSLPPDAQAQYPTPEAMLAPLLANSFPSDVVGYEMTAGYPVKADPQAAPGSSDWGVQIKMQRSDGTVFTTGAGMEKVDGQWKVFVSAAGIEKLAQGLAGGDLKVGF